MRPVGSLAAVSLCVASLACAFDQGGVGMVPAPDLGPVDGPPPLDLGPDVRIVGLADATPQMSDGVPCAARVCEDGRTYCPSGPNGKELDRVCPLGCNTSGDDCSRFLVSNVPAATLEQGEDDWSVSGAVEIDTSTGQLVVNGTTAQLPPGVALLGTADYLVVVLRRLTVTPKATLRLIGRRPLVVVASDAVVIEGTVDCAARGPYPGAGGSPAVQGGCGDGPRAEYDGLLPLPPFRGGAGGSLGGKGGRGGESGPASRAPCGTSGLSPLIGGSAGGAGIGGTRGGGGGGAIQLSAWSSITIGPGGVIDCAGGGGSGAQAPGPSSGGGGGSGGSILLEAPKVEIRGVVAANGGAGGGGAIFTESGKQGADGAASSERARGGDGASGLISVGGDGGWGSGGSVLDGVEGGGADSAGGGGGGAGRIVVRAVHRVLAGAKAISPEKAPARFEATLEAID